MSRQRPRGVEVFRPYPDEVPWALLAESGPDEDALAALLDPHDVRVAKQQGRVTGAYAIRMLDATGFELVALAVADGHRGRGVGRWLLGHAIGLTETRGGRVLVWRGRSGHRFLQRMGFQEHGDALRLLLTPE